MRAPRPGSTGELSVLGQVIFRNLGRAVLVRAAIDRRDGVKVAVRRRYRGHPLEGIRLPRVAFGPSAAEEAPEEVDNKGDLRQPQQYRTDRNEDVDGLQRLQELILQGIVDAPHMTPHPENVHGEEGAIEEDEGAPEVDLPQRVVHHAAEHLWEPIVDGG